MTLKMNEKLNKLFKKRNLIIILLNLILVILGFTFFEGNNPSEMNEIGTIGFNKTVSWEYDYTNFLLVLKYSSLFIFLLGYGILALTKYFPNLKLSILHLVIIVATFILYDVLKSNAFILILINLISFLIFIVNIIYIMNLFKNRLY